MTRYDWNAIPDMYTWVAKDSDGRVKAYSERPTLGDRCWYSSFGGTEQLGYSPPWESDSDWKESLEHRPNLTNRYRLDPTRWDDSGIIDTTTNHDLTFGEVLNLLNGRSEASNE